MITSFDGKAITSADQLSTAIQADKPGQTVKIGLYRGQTQMTVTANLGIDQPGPTAGRGLIPGVAYGRQMRSTAGSSTLEASTGAVRETRDGCKSR